MTRVDVRSVRAVIGFLLALTLLLLGGDVLASDSRVASAASVIIGVCSVIAITRAHPGRPITLGSVYALLYALFHMGLLVPIALGLPLELLNASDERWVSSDGFAWAAIHVAMGQAAFTAVYLAVSAPGAPIPGTPADVPKQARIDRSGTIGIMLLCTGMALWLYIALSAGVSLVGGSYLAFLAGTGESAITYSYLLMGLGMGVAGASRSTAIRRITLLLFGPWSLVAFTLGLRGEVIIPAAAFLIAQARHRHLPLRPWMAFAGVAVLAAGSLVRVARGVGLAGGGTGLGSASPFSGLTELGYSIRPMVVVLGQRAAGEDPVGAATYLAPWRRLLVGRLAGGETVSAADDPAVFSTMIASRIGPIGGSVSAEAYRSGGVIGILLVLGLLGLAVAWLDGRPTGLYTDAAVGMISFSLLLWVRNDVTPVPLHLVLAAVVLLLMRLFAKPPDNASRRRTRNSVPMVPNPTTASVRNRSRP